MLLNITKSMMILAMLFLFSCSKDSTSTNPDTENEVLKSTSLSMSLAGSMSGQKSVSIITKTSSGTDVSKSYVIQGMIGLSDVAQVIINPATNTIAVNLTETITQKSYLSTTTLNISRNDDKVLEGTFSGEASRFPDGSGSEKVSISNGKIYINKTNF